MKLMRTATGLKQNDIARQLGVTSNYISLVENGKREPSVSFLRALARIFKVPVGLFFLWEEAEPHSSKAGLAQLRDILAQLESMYLLANYKKIRKSAASL